MLDLLLITLAVCLIWLWLQSRPFYWRGKGIEWKVPLPLLGNTGGSLFTPWHRYWKKFYTEAGDRSIMGFHFFGKPALLIKDPELIKKVAVTDADHFMAREFHSNPIVDITARSVFFSRGQEWKDLRAKLTPYFTPARMKAILPIVESNTNRFIQYLDQQSKIGPVNVHDASHKLSTDIIISSAFGLQPEAFDNPDSFFCHLQKEMVSFWLGLRILVSIMAPKLYDLLELKFLSDSTTKKLSGFVYDVMEKREKGEGVRRDFLQGMIEIMQQDMKIPTLDRITRFDRETVVAQCISMYGAGTEPTANALSFVLYELAVHPDIQEKTRQEIQDMLTRTSGQYVMDELSSLPFVNKVISETLRKHPVAVGLGRMCTKTYRLTDQIEIQPGTIVIAPAIALHSDPNIFSDPDKFDPERFSKEATVTPGTYIPFGLGPRTCIGMKLAEMEILFVLVKLLLQFRLSPCEKTDIPVKYSNSPTLSPKDGLWLTLEAL